MREQPVMPDRPIRENKVEEHLVKECVARGWRCWKLKSTGLPDRLVVCPRAVIAFVETKTKGGKLSALQARNLDWLNQHAHIAFAVFNKEDVDHFISLLEKKIDKKI